MESRVPNGDSRSVPKSESLQLLEVLFGWGLDLVRVNVISHNEVCEMPHFEGVRTLIYPRWSHGNNVAQNCLVKASSGKRWKRC